jgi:hypothetical protein
MLAPRKAEATYTFPFATTGTIFALPPVCGQDPASFGPKSSWYVPLPSDPENAPENAERLTPGEVLDRGRETAQMIGVFVQAPNAPLPLQETAVKKPASCPLEILDVPSGEKPVGGNVGLTGQV